MEKYSRPGQATDDNIIRLMHFACWITQDTFPLRISNTYCFSLATTLRDRGSVLRFTYIYCVFLFVQASPALLPSCAQV